MVASRTATTSMDARGAPRDEVMHRTRGVGADGAVMKLVIVNISATGLMARCELVPDVGAVIGVELPILGRVPATVRWVLGGRIGCAFDAPIPLAEYYGMLSTLLRSV
ncbi:PilZ domain-containing protein [Sphingomonas ginsenosidivorax]|uniref:PilZ domain-containing protein n=1 Tax=Sphingomonas ginsenosidivorax TaxID=862135 RepID=A0A5C6UD61_9SPHN|nr:PilZ domain-containing protein [Sphingomonas ginsenosidivorax]